MAKTKEIVIPKLPYGEGSIWLRKDGTLGYRKYIGEGINKKPVCVYGTTIKELMDKMKLKEKETEEGLETKLNETLSEAMNSWLANFKKPLLKASSYDRLECTIKNQVDAYSIADIKYQNINSLTIQQHINELVQKNYSQSTIKKLYDALNDFYRDKHNTSEIKINPMLTVKMPSSHNIRKQRKEIEFFDDDDIKKFTHEASKLMSSKNQPKYKLGYAFIAMIYLGLRAGEMIALRWKDVDFNNNYILINKSIHRVINRENSDVEKSKGVSKFIDVEGTTKTKGTRIVPMNAEALQAMNALYLYSEYKKPDDYVIATRSRGCNNLKNMTDRLHIIESAAGTKVQQTGIHVLRHTCASLYFRRGIQVELIASILGHSVDVCNNVYIHLVEEQKINASMMIGQDFDRFNPLVQLGLNQQRKQIKM